MKNDKEKKERVQLYLTVEEKLALKAKADTVKQGLSRYVRNCIFKRINKNNFTNLAISERINLSKVQSSIMLIQGIVKGSHDDVAKEEVLKELESLQSIVNILIMTNLNN